MASRQAWRRAWWQVHKWIGLILMILLIPLGLSGAVLAWDDAVDHALNPQRYAVSGHAVLAPSAYAQATKAALGPDERITMIRLPQGDDPVTVMATKVGKPGAGGGRPQRVTLWFDPPTARLLAQLKGDSGLVRFAHVLHGSFFLPGPGVGRTMVGLLGVAMFLMAATGVWIWWPQVGSFAKGLRWLRGDRKLDTNLHHMVGFWIALPLAFQAFTGVWIAWPQMMAVAGLTPPLVGPMERARMVPAADTALTPERAIAAARTAGGDGAAVSIAWPVGEKGPWRVTLKGAGEVTVDDATGTAKRTPPRGGLAMTIRHLHDGSAIGWGWRLLMLSWGLAPTLLGITGLLMWLRGRRWRAEAARRKAKVREPVAAG